jgi:predicted nucleic acid-binding protein
MILVDTNILVALVDPRDPLRAAALDDLVRLGRRQLVLTWPVLAEAVHLLATGQRRRALRKLINDYEIAMLAESDGPGPQALFEWLDRYDEHEPDLADAYLVVATALNRKLRVWSYDGEFHSTWRRPDGSPVPLVARN